MRVFATPAQKRFPPRSQRRLPVVSRSAAPVCQRAEICDILHGPHLQREQEPTHGEVGGGLETQAQALHGVGRRESPVRSPLAIRGGSAPLQIMRSEIFSSTMEICHRVLFSRTFSVSEGSVTVIANAHWEGPSVGSSEESCGASTYPMTLTQEGLIFDSELASCDFRVDRADIRTWTGVPPDDYHLTIWPNNTNPHCCLVGTIQVLEQSGVSGPSCGGRTRQEISALDVLHTALDAAGLFPALGIIPDAVNAGIYSIEGDWTNAGISAAAMVPFLGQGATLTRYGLRATERGLLAVGREGIEAGIRAARGGGRLARHLRSKMRRIRNAIAAGGNRGVAGSVTTDEAMQLGVEFVGPNYRVMSGGRGIVSQDGLRQFRFPSPKRGIDPMTGEPFSRTGVQSNFEQRAAASGEWTSNVHLDVEGR